MLDISKVSSVYKLGYNKEIISEKNGFNHIQVKTELAYYEHKFVPSKFVFTEFFFIVV